MFKQPYSTVVLNLMTECSQCGRYPELGVTKNYFIAEANWFYAGELVFCPQCRKAEFPAMIIELAAEGLIEHAGR